MFNHWRNKPSYHIPAYQSRRNCSFIKTIIAKLRICHLLSNVAIAKIWNCGDDQGEVHKLRGQNVVKRGHLDKISALDKIALCT